MITKNPAAVGVSQARAALAVFWPPELRSRSTRREGRAKWMHVKRVTWRTVLVCLFSTSISSANERYRVDWQAGPSCPPLAQLYDEIARRTNQLEVANDGLSLSIDVQQDAVGYYVGRVTLPGERSREVKATS